MAPEQQSGGQYEQSADIHALGASFCELLCFHLPFNSTFGHYDAKQEISAGVREMLPPLLLPIIELMVASNPSLRPSAVKVVEILSKRAEVEVVEQIRISQAKGESKK